MVRCFLLLSFYPFIITNTVLFNMKVDLILIIRMVISIVNNVGLYNNNNNITT